MTITSTNFMLEDMPAHRGGIDGLKTGTTDKAGEYNFACGMDMFHGKVVVK